jgi:hypothetical protein
LIRKGAPTGTGAIREADFLGQCGFANCLVNRADMGMGEQKKRLTGYLRRICVIS